MTERTSEIVDRVALVIDRYAFEGPPPGIDDPSAYAWVLPKDEAERRVRQEAARDKARRAIATMREPTAAMVRAGVADGVQISDGATVGTFDSSDSWRAMIDEALK